MMLAALPPALVAPSHVALGIMLALVEMLAVGFTPARRFVAIAPLMPSMLAVPITVIVAERDNRRARADGHRHIGRLGGSAGHQRSTGEDCGGDRDAEN